MTLPRKRLSKPGEPPIPWERPAPPKTKGKRAATKASDAGRDLTTVGSAFVKVSKRVKAKPEPGPKLKARKRATTSTPAAKSAKPAKPAKKAKRTRAAKPPKVEVQTFENWKATMTPRERRVDDIVERMSQGAWLSGVSTREMARKWNVNVAVVEMAAAEASRVLRRTLRDDPEFILDVRVEVLQTFRVIRGMSMSIAADKSNSAGSRVVALSNALASTRMYGFYLGIEPTKGVTGQIAETTETEFDNWTTEQLDNYARTGKRPDEPGPGGGPIH